MKNCFDTGCLPKVRDMECPPCIRGLAHELFKRKIFGEDRFLGAECAEVCVCGASSDLQCTGCDVRICANCWYNLWESIAVRRIRDEERCLHDLFPRLNFDLLDRMWRRMNPPVKKEQNNDSPGCPRPSVQLDSLKIPGVKEEVDNNSGGFTVPGTTSSKL